MSPLLGTGETSVEETSCHGLLTNTSHNIVDHAGLKEPLQLLLIESIFRRTLASHKLPWLLKSLLTVVLEDHAKVVALLASMSSLTATVFQNNPAKTIWLKIQPTLIAHQCRTVWTVIQTHVGLFKASNSGRLLNMEQLLVLIE